MKKFKIYLSTAILVLVCSFAFVFAGCGEKDQNPDDLIGVYSATQVEVYYENRDMNSPVPVYKIDAENNENDVAKGLSRFLIDMYGDTRYEVKKSGDKYIFETQELNDGNVYVTADTSVPLGYWASDDRIELKTDNGSESHFFWFKDGVIYISEDGYNQSVNNSHFNNEQLKQFMLDNGISSYRVRCVLEK